jgi:hypothetical protein
VEQSDVGKTEVQTPTMRLPQALGSLSSKGSVIGGGCDGLGVAGSTTRPKTTGTFDSSFNAGMTTFLVAHHPTISANQVIVSSGACSSLSVNVARANADQSGIGRM